MKKWAAVVAILGAALLGWFFFSHEKPPSPLPPSPQERSVEETAALSNALATQDAKTVAIIQSNFARVQASRAVQDADARGPTIAPAGAPTPLEFTNVEPSIVLENMARAVRQYGTMFGGNPVGTNPEITSQLNGNNPKHINFINPEAGMRINEKGELVDAWGTPYFFHQLSGTDMEIHSAGPDRIMWTSDDLVSH
jgi:hypothetical protein